MGFGFSRYKVLLSMGMVIVSGYGSIIAQNVSATSRIPEVHGSSFTDQAVKLPEALQGKIGVLVVGFTRGSQDSVAGWGKRLGADYYDSTTVQYYELPILAGVPRLMRGFVIGQIKGSVPDRAKGHFLPITENEAGWRTAADYKGGDDAYVMVVDGQGAIRWQTHGAVSDAVYEQLKKQIEVRAMTVSLPGQ